MRLAFFVMIAASWIAIVAIMLKEYRTVPSAAQMADVRPVRPPLPADLVKHIAMSSAEFLAAAFFLWPWWRRAYAARALLASLALSVWFIYSAPLMSLNRMELQHRRWLALLVVATFAAAIASGLVSALRLSSRRWRRRS